MVVLTKELKERSLEAAITAPTVKRNTESTTGLLGTTPRKMYSATKVRGTENLRSTVTMGKDKACVPPNPKTKFPKKHKNECKICNKRINVINISTMYKICFVCKICTAW